MDIEESNTDKDGFKEFISKSVKDSVDNLISQFGVVTVALNCKEIRYMFEEELNKYLK
jgi:hypothetical protein